MSIRKYAALVVGHLASFLRALSSYTITLPARKLKCTSSTSTLQSLRDVDVQAKYHAPLGVDDGVFLGEAYPNRYRHSINDHSDRSAAAETPWLQLRIRQPQEPHARRLSTLRSGIAHLLCPVLSLMTYSSTAPQGHTKSN